MEKKIVYVVKCSSGNWDDRHSWIEGIYENVEDAEKLKIYLDNEAKTIKEANPIEYSENMSDEEERIYESYSTKYQKFCEWNGAIVENYILNEPFL